MTSAEDAQSADDMTAPATWPPSVPGRVRLAVVLAELREAGPGGHHEATAGRFPAAASFVNWAVGTRLASSPVSRQDAKDGQPKRLKISRVVTDSRRGEKLLSGVDTRLQIRQFFASLA